jgi:hypothetical protein
MAEENAATSSGLFSVFILSMYSLVLIPYTIYHLCNTSDDTTQPVVKVCGGHSDAMLLKEGLVLICSCAGRCRASGSRAQRSAKPWRSYVPEVSGQTAAWSAAAPCFTAADALATPSPAGNILLLLAWIAWLGMLWYTQANMGDMKAFDPFEILGLPSDASDKEIRKAYRNLSLKYHPDKVRPAAAAGPAAAAAAAAAATTERAGFNGQKL